MKKAYAVVLGVNDTGYGVIRSLSSANVPIIGFEKDFSQPEVHTRLCEEIVPYDNEDHLLEQMIARGKVFEKKPALFFTSDPLVLFVDKHREILSSYYNFHLPHKEIVESLINKHAFKQRARELGCSIPRTEFIDGSRNLAQVIEALVPPFIIKPYMKSVSWKNARLEKAIILTSKEECLRTVPGLLKIEKNLILQEYIPGGDDAVYFCLVYFDANHTCKAYFCGKKVRQWPSLVGDTSSAIRSDHDGIVRETLRFFEAVGYEGFGSMEYKLHPGNSHAYMIEPTVGRCDHQSYVAMANGINIPLAAYRALTGDDMTEFCFQRSSDEIMWIDEPHEILTILDLLKRKPSSLGKVIQSLCKKKAYRFMNRKDPIVTLYFLLWSARQIMRRSAVLFRRFSMFAFSDIVYDFIQFQLCNIGRVVLL
jgi:predicted ATP-grasp superfamily ATP-dependent carboligase